LEETTALDSLVALLDIEVLEENYFRGVSPPGQGRRIFGGQVLGQALMAAGRTAQDRPIHSIQAYFLLAGDPTVPILFEVDRIRDGRSFTTRRVRAVQHGEAIFAMSASFHDAEQGPEHQAPMPQIPGPDEVPEPSGPYRGGRANFSMWGRSGPVTVRSVDPADRRDPGDPHEQLMWMKADGSLPADPLLHACIVAYASDMGMVSAIAMPHARGLGGVAQPPGGRGGVVRSPISNRELFPSNFMMASLDHAMWFHRIIRADEWFLYSRYSPSAHGARGLAQGHMYAQDGTLGVTIVQEGLIRPMRNR
jgi:acyl-CoA thioesterase-2